MIVKSSGEMVYMLRRSDIGIRQDLFLAVYKCED
jgi:hypothetical protein